MSDHNPSDLPSDPMNTSDATNRPDSTAREASTRCISKWRKQLQPVLLVTCIAGLAFLWWTLRNNPEGLLKPLFDPEFVQLGDLFPVRLADNRTTPADFFEFKNTRIPKDEIRFSNVGSDGIRALNHPHVISAKLANHLKPNDRIIGVVVDGSTRAYPLHFLNHHQVVNDRVGDVPILVTYCPLSDAVAVFDRRSNDVEFNFEISGMLYNSNMLLFDRIPDQLPENLWSQLKAESVTGPLSGRQLQPLPVELTTWSDWTDRHPHSEVLARPFSIRIRYGSNPHRSYQQRPGLIYPVKPLNNRLPLKARVLGVWTKNAARAFPVSTFQHGAASKEIKTQLDGASFTVGYNPKSKSLRIVESDGDIHWMYSYWFAWYAFHPKTEVFQADETRAPVQAN